MPVPFFNSKEIIVPADSCVDLTGVAMVDWTWHNGASFNMRIHLSSFCLRGAVNHAHMMMGPEVITQYKVLTSNTHWRNVCKGWKVNSCHVSFPVRFCTSLCLGLDSRLTLLAVNLKLNSCQFYSDKTVVVSYFSWSTLMTNTGHLNFCSKLPDTFNAIIVALLK